MDDAKGPVRRTGVIGLGAMGLALARHMVDKGFELAGYDIDVDAMRRAADHGVASCLSSGEVGERASTAWASACDQGPRAPPCRDAANSG